MTNLRLGAIPAAFAAAGLLSIGSAYAANQASGAPATGVFSQGTFNPTNYAVVSQNLYSPTATSAPTATGGFIFVTLKPTQTAWGYALTDSTFAVTNGTHTLSHTYTTGTNTCSLSYVVSYDPAGIMTVAYGAATSSLGSATTAVSACKTAFSNQSGLPAATFSGTTKSYTLIY